MGPPAISLPENCQRNGEDGIAGLCHCVGHQEKCTVRAVTGQEGLNLGELQHVRTRPLGWVPYPKGARCRLARQRAVEHCKTTGKRDMPGIE